MNTLNGIVKYSAMVALLMLSSGCIVSPGRADIDGRDHDRGSQDRDGHRCGDAGHDEHCSNHER